MFARARERVGASLESVGDRLLGPGSSDRDARYLDRLLADCGFVHPIGIGEEQFALDLAHIYVPIFAVRREPPSLGAERDAQDKVAEVSDIDSAYPYSMLGVRNVLSGLAQLRLPLARLSDPKSLAAHFEGAPPIRNFQLTTRLLIVGHAGAGKSTTLRHAVLTLCNAFTSKEPSILRRGERSLGLHLPECPFPIYVRLTHFAASLPDDLGELGATEKEQYLGAPSELFVEWLRRNTSQQDGDWSAADAIVDPTSTALVVLDGFDEAGDEDKRAYVAKVINNLVRDYPDHRYVVASRPTGIGGRIHLNGFEQMRLLPLDPAAIEQLSYRWFAAAVAQAKRGDGLVAQALARSLLGAIDKNPRLSEMATNPLLLTAMALMHFKQLQLPDQRARLYDDLVRLLIDIWRKQQTASDVPRKTRTVAEVTTERRRLEHIALELQSGSSLSQTFSLAQAQSWLRPKLIEIGLTNDEADAKVATMLESVALESGLVRRDGDYYSFAHYTFQEYLAARALDGRPDGVEFLLQHFDDERWREPLLLAVGNWSNGQQLAKAEGVVRGLLRKDEPGALVLAGDALVDVGQIDEFRLLRAEVGAALGKVAISPNASSTTRLHAAVCGDQLRAVRVPSLLSAGSESLWSSPLTIPMDEGSCESRLTIFPVTCNQYSAMLARIVQLDESAAERLCIPQFHAGAPPGKGDFPVLVSHSTAKEFAEWMQRERPTRMDVEDQLVIRLPTVAELREAGRGLPDELDSVARKYKPVGIFPEHASVHGVQDIARANPIREWTSSDAGRSPLLGSFRLAIGPAVPQ